MLSIQRVVYKEGYTSSCVVLENCSVDGMTLTVLPQRFKCLPKTLLALTLCLRACMHARYYKDTAKRCRSRALQILDPGPRPTPLSPHKKKLPKNAFQSGTRRTCDQDGCVGILIPTGAIFRARFTNKVKSIIMSLNFSPCQLAPISLAEFVSKLIYI